jgi:hypothetical protein
VTPGPDGPPVRRRSQAVRLVVGALAEFGIKAYGAAAAVSVALSDEETVAGKGGDAVAAVRNLKDRYDSAEYVFKNRQEIQSALDYVNENTPPQAELEAAAVTSSETLSKIGTTYDEVSKAREALDDIGFSPRSVVGGAQEAFGHVQKAFEARPDVDSLRELGARAEQFAPLVGQVRVLTGDYYEDLFDVMDNFSGDEIAATLGVMAAALALAFLLGQAVGFWARRGRPGLLARTLQRLGAQVFRRWYVSNLPYALSTPLYAAARERLQRDIVADPQEALDPDVFRDLESWFASRSDGAP